MVSKTLWFYALVSGIVVLALLLTLLPARAAPAADYDPNQLSYGLYWFGKDGANQKFEPGVANSYFDPAQPTLIFVHGWQPFLSQNLPDFDFNGQDTAAAWIDDGWNVGIFVWNQFSDETEGVLGGGDWFAGGPPQGVKDAEAKIWTPGGPKGMRWRDWDDLMTGYSDPPTGTPSAAELFYQEYVAALEGYTGAIRIAGHSLGNQMAVRLTKLVHDGIAAGTLPEHLRPTRVALLDPYWSPDPRTYLDGKRTGEVVREYVAELLPTGTLFEWYWSSEWTTPDEGYANDALKPMMLYAAMDPTYAVDNKDKHMAPRYLYFWSKAFEQDCTGIGDACRLLGQMSDAQLAVLMRSDYYWTQSAGQATDTPGDDVYTATQRIDAPYAVMALQADALTQTVGSLITVTATVTASASPAPDGTLVTFETDRGVISARAVVSDGVALAHIGSDVTGTAHLSATTEGTGGAVQSMLSVTFTEAVVECTPLTGVAIVGPVDVSGTLYTDMAYTFQAHITPTEATPPITYTWGPVPLNGQNHDSATYRWIDPDVYTVTLTAENCGGPVEAAPRTLTVAASYRIYLPLVMRNQ
jgi:hypothetical protein